MLDVVKTQNGIVKGYPGNNQFITVFKGIPFAKPPKDNLRWKAPQAVENWDGILDCFEYKHIPHQPRFSSEGGNLAAAEFYVRDYERSEDCLYLNIFTPAKSENDNLPVVIYIHGGGFETGYSYLNAYDGESFAKKGIVYVSITYRLNVFGFLISDELKDEYGAGNFGILDQIEALKWIKENISYFGGNPSRITLMGQSAGGVSVQNLITSPLSKNFIKRAIMQSGGGLTYKGPLDALDKNTAIKKGNKFLNFLGASSIEDARKMHAEDISEKYTQYRKSFKGNLEFTPIVDNDIIPSHSYEFFTKGKHNDMEILIGSTADEMRAKRNLSDDEKKEIIFSRFDEEIANKYIKEIAENNFLPDIYFENRVGEEMNSAGIAFAENELRLNRKPTYLYHFKYVPPGAEDIGAHHSVEHHYVFQTLNRSFRKYTVGDYEKSLILSDLWANFIKSGNPSSDEVKWEPYKGGLENVLLIDDEIKLGKLEINKNVKFLVEQALNYNKE